MDSRSLTSSNTASRRILLVARDDRLSQAIERYYEAMGSQVIRAREVKTALKIVAGDVDFAVVDASDLEDAWPISELSESLGRPLLAIASSPSNDESATLLRAGADIVIAKPFTLDALEAYAEALSRHENGQPRPSCDIYSYQDLAVDFRAHSVILSGERIHLPATQYRLLELLCRNAGAILTPAQISQWLWGRDYEENDSLIKAHVRNLRLRLNDSAKGARFVRTEKGIGYCVPKSDQPALRRLAE
jgi:two-component system KDP operon response regulator KdpE